MGGCGFISKTMSCKCGFTGDNFKNQTDIFTIHNLSHICISDHVWCEITVCVVSYKSCCDSMYGL